MRTYHTEQQITNIKEESQRTRYKNLNSFTTLVMRTDKRNWRTAASDLVGESSLHEQSEPVGLADELSVALVGCQVDRQGHHLKVNLARKIYFSD